MGTTNYVDTFIAIAPDSAADRGIAPREAENPSIALRTYRMIRENPYRYTSDDVIFTVYADRNGIRQQDREEARRAFFSKGQACLRASDLGKRYGWGVHSDGTGCVALYGVESAEYAAFVSGERAGSDGKAVAVVPAMRSRAAPK
ncbi:DUF6157 family protein [Vulgatibacter incomptus]|uniref:Uncharacterized protein n=1 Tax=Vulgatibacter incomptus TaxID=1391653 RepID=A0A0K1PGG4_9BACT|nr:DUF6157 family protein [Vulgatibacter incomptus]AKU92597.1 hypothetical protein AKJ08_2984 [Vulgatibacter incomptus]